MADDPSKGHVFRVGRLSRRNPTPFAVKPDAAARSALAADLDLIALPRVAFTGELRPAGRGDWHLAGRLVADVEQACVVTLAPVRTHIDEAVVRRYVADLPEPAAAEIEMPEDDTVEPLGTTIDVDAVLREALSLALPAYPRAPGAEFAAEGAGHPGPEPDEERRKPFAGLADLLGGKDGEN